MTGMLKSSNGLGNGFRFQGLGKVPKSPILTPEPDTGIYQPIPRNTQATRVAGLATGHPGHTGCRNIQAPTVSPETIDSNL
jgi:hypothetical protein